MEPQRKQKQRHGAKRAGEARKPADGAKPPLRADEERILLEATASRAEGAYFAEAERLSRKAIAKQRVPTEAASLPAGWQTVKAQPASSKICLSYGPESKLNLGYGTAPETVERNALPARPRRHAQAPKRAKEEDGLTESVSLVPESDGNAQKVKAYSMQTKESSLKSTVCEVPSSPVGRVKSASLKARSTGFAFVQECVCIYYDGFLCIKSAAEDQVMYIKAKAADPITSRALSIYDSKFKPRYVKLQDGVAHFVGTARKNVVVVKLKLSDNYTSPLLSAAIGARERATSKVDQISVSIRDGAAHVSGVVGERSLSVRTKLSETLAYKQLTNILEIVSAAYGKGGDKLRVIQCSIKDRCLYIACKANDRLLVVKITAAGAVEQMLSKYAEFYAATRTSLAGACNGAKLSILNATEITRSNAAGANTKMRSLAAHPDARAAAAGGVVLGTSGAVTGLLAGGAVGAVCALPAAFFTFGLSIPVGVAVGAGGGLCVGGSAGVVAGGVAGYKARSGKEVIGGALANVKVQKDKALDSASKASSNLRSRLPSRISGTGSTAN